MELEIPTTYMACRVSNQMRFAYSWSLEVFLEKTMKFTLSERCSEHCWFFLVRSDMSLIRMISSLRLSWQNTCDHVVSNTRNKNDGETRISWVDEPKCLYGVTNQTGTGVALELDISANMKGLFVLLSSCLAYWAQNCILLISNDNLCKTLNLFLQ